MAVTIKDINYIETGEVGWQDIIDNFAALKVAVEALQTAGADYLKHDGTVAMTGNLDIAHNQITDCNLLLTAGAPLELVTSGGFPIVLDPTSGVEAAHYVQISTPLGLEMASNLINHIGSIDGVSPALIKVSTTAVGFNATGQTTLYTVPTGMTFMPVMAIIRVGGDAGATDVTFGRVGALTDWLGTIQLDNLDAVGDQVKVEQINANPPTKSKTYAAGQVFQIDVTVANGVAINLVDLFGYLV